MSGTPSLSRSVRPPPSGSSADRQPSVARRETPVGSRTAAQHSSEASRPMQCIDARDTVTAAPAGVSSQAHRCVRSSRTGMRFDPLTPLEGWKALGAKISFYSEATSWWLGDWLLFGQMKYGRRYKEGVALTGLDYQTLRNYAAVARRFDLSRRRDNLSFQHHAEVCALADDIQDSWLDLAAASQWSKTELRRRVRAAADCPARRGPSATLRLVVEAHRDERWRQAARQSGSAFEEWMTKCLDAAATAALDDSSGSAFDPSRSDGMLRRRPPLTKFEREASHRA